MSLLFRTYIEYSMNGSVLYFAACNGGNRKIMEHEDSNRIKLFTMLYDFYYNSINVRFLQIPKS